MQTIKINDMYECPFQHEESYQYSELTWGSDTKCTILKDDCFQKNCPLKKQGIIKVIWNVKEQ